MRTSLINSNNDKCTLIAEMSDDSTFQVFEYDYLRGVGYNKSIVELNALRELNVKLKQVRIELEESYVKIRVGLLSYMRGAISLANKSKTNTTISSKFLKKKSIIQYTNILEFSGSGEIFLEASFGYFVLLELEDEEIIINEDIFCACGEGIDISVMSEKNSVYEDEEVREVSTLKLKGEGIAILELPVSENEIIKCKVYKDKFWAKENMVVLTTNNIELATEKNNKQFSIIEEEGLSLYSGTGEIWLLPTKNAYNVYTEEIYALQEDY